MTARCPQCAGERIPEHWAGLVFDHALTCPLLAAEDARKVADRDLTAAGEYSRPTTDAERTLLAACGGDPGAIPETTDLVPVSRGQIGRRWAGYDPDHPPAPKETTP